MATKKAAAPAEEAIEEIQEEAVYDPYERVPVKLNRESGADEVVYVSVNDYSCTIPRGKTVMVPRFIKEEIDRSEAAKEALHLTEESLMNQGK